MRKATHAVTESDGTITVHYSDDSATTHLSEGPVSNYVAQQAGHVAKGLAVRGGRAAARGVTKFVAQKLGKAAGKQAGALTRKAVVAGARAAGQAGEQYAAQKLQQAVTSAKEKLVGMQPQPREEPVAATEGVIRLYGWKSVNPDSRDLALESRYAMMEFGIGDAVDTGIGMIPVVGTAYDAARGTISAGRAAFNAGMSGVNTLLGRKEAAARDRAQMIKSGADALGRAVNVGAAFVAPGVGQIATKGLTRVATNVASKAATGAITRGVAKAATKGVTGAITRGAVNLGTKAAVRSAGRNVKGAIQGAGQNAAQKMTGASPNPALQQQQRQQQQQQQQQQKERERQQQQQQQRQQSAAESVQRVPFSATELKEFRKLAGLRTLAG